MKIVTVLLAALFLVSAASAAEYDGIGSLKTSCQVEGVSCKAVSDVTSGNCRTVDWTSDHGAVRIKGCEKGSKVEVYRQEYPGGVSFTACLGEQGCVDQWGGWRSFTPAAGDVESTGTPTDGGTDGAPDNNDPAGDGSVSLTGLDGKYEAMIQAWQDREIDTLSVQGQKMIVAPWFVDDAGRYHTGCGAAGTASDYCVVTDEDSQYTLAVSMSRDPGLVNAQAEPLFNKIRQISTTGYGHNTRWQFRVKDGNILLGTDDFASDADARYLIALWNFVNNPALEDGQLKTDIRAYATAYCADYKEHAFVADEHEGITYWPAGGGNVGRVGSLEESGNWWGVTYPGYYGDMSLAMLACGANTGDPNYFKVSDDALEAYFEIADYDGSSLRIAHGRAGVWTVDQTGDVGYKCQDGCPSHRGTEDADGVRFTSICTVNHFADELGLGFTPLADSFCGDLVSSSGYEDTAYVVQWSGDGQPVSGLNGGWQANGLPLYIDIDQTSWADDRFGSVWSAQWTGSSFSDARLFDIFWGGFLVNGLGMNLGRSDATFGLESSTDYNYDGGDTTSDTTPDNGADGSIDGTTPTLEEQLALCQDENLLREDGISLLNSELDQANQRIAELEAQLSVMRGTVDQLNAELDQTRQLLADAETDLLACTDQEPTSDPPSEPTPEEPGSSPEQLAIETLSVTLSVDGTKTQDLIEGSSCRFVEYSSEKGTSAARICKKGGDRYEVYYLTEPNGADICVEGYCVGSRTGFASFTV